MKNAAKLLISILILSSILTGCQAIPAQSQANPTASLATPKHTLTSNVIDAPEIETTEATISISTPVVTQETNSKPQPTQPPQFSPTPRPTLGPDDWQELPIFPTEVSERAREIYQRGLARGNEPTHFSKLGDCQNITTY